MADGVHPLSKLRRVAQRGDGRRRVPQPRVPLGRRRDPHTGWGERFEHPTKTWACATHKQFTMQAVAVAIAKAWVRGKCEEAMREVLGAGRGVQAGEVETPAMAAEAGRETRRGAESDEESDGCNGAQ